MTPAKIADVLLVLPVLDPSGAERIVAELATRLGAFGFPASVLCLEDETAAVGLELKAAGIQVTGLRLSRRNSSACGRAIAEHILTQNPNGPLVVCSHLFHANFASRIAARILPAASKRRVRFLSTVHVAERRFRPWQFLLDRITARFASGEICISKSVEEFHREKTGLPATFFTIIENGINLTTFKALKAPDAARQIHIPRVVSVGRLNAQKDYSTLLRAWKIVSAKKPSATLEIAGSGPEETRLKALCATLKLVRVEFVGFCTDVPAFLSGADVYVQSSAWEGLPLTVVEAMAAGLPVVASGVDSLPEMLEDGRTGILFERGNEKMLAERIVDLLNDPARAKSIGAAAREIALKRFSAERMTEEYARLFQKVLSERPA